MEPEEWKAQWPETKANQCLSGLRIDPRSESQPEHRVTFFWQGDKKFSNSEDRIMKLKEPEFTISYYPYLESFGLVAILDDEGALKPNPETNMLAMDLICNCFLSEDFEPVAKVKEANFVALALYSSMPMFGPVYLAFNSLEASQRFTRYATSPKHCLFSGQVAHVWPEKRVPKSETPVKKKAKQ